MGRKHIANQIFKWDYWSFNSPIFELIFTKCNISFINIIFVVFLFISCGNNPIQISVVRLEPIKCINQFKDSIFFSAIRSIYFDDGCYYLSDYEGNMILVLNQDLEFIKSFGKKGKGPGEFSGASHIFKSDNLIYIYNDGKKAFEVFSDSYINTIYLPKELNYTSDIRFSIKNNQIYLSNPNEFSSISCISADGSIINNFGELNKYRTNKETIIKNNRHICILGNKLMSVSDNYPKIEIYDLDGKKVTEHDFSNLYPFKNLIKFTDKQGLDANSYYKIICDIYAFENKLFLLILSVNEENKIKANKILQFESEGQTLKPTKIIDLGEGWFGPICIAEDCIVTFNHITSELTKYDLP